MQSFSTPDICDAHAEDASIGLQVLEPIMQDYGGQPSFCGIIATVKCFEDNSRIWQQLEQDGTGKVLVVDGGGSKGCALMGDIMADLAVKNGWQGVIINGCVRDLDDLGRIKLGVKALAPNPLRKPKLGVGEVDVSVTFGGVEFIPGQYVYADRNGVLVSAIKLL